MFEESDTNPGFTKNAKNLVSNLENRDSLDFKHQENKSLKNYDPSKPIRFAESKRITELKKTFTEENMLPKITDLELQASNQQRNITDNVVQEMVAFKEETLKMLPYF